MKELETSQTGMDKQAHEDLLTQSMEQELTDEQLQQLAEGSCSWGANCNKSCGS